MYNLYNISYKVFLKRKRKVEINGKINININHVGDNNLSV